jgi:hypothetical protein
MNETTKNFIEAIDAWQQSAAPADPVTYRLYYDDAGNPVCYSMEQLPGQFVEITAAQFARSDAHVQVRDGVICSVPKPVPAHLVPAAQGTACADGDVSIVVDDQQPHLKWKLSGQHDNHN